MANLQEQRRREFLNHLARWASNHESSAYFDGKISLSTRPESIDRFELGRSIKCFLTESSSGTSKLIVVRLFPPRSSEQRYRLVVRCGAGWMGARHFLSKEFFCHQYAQKMMKRRYLPPSSQSKADIRALKSTDEHAVRIQPLFHTFLRLPLELQQMILGIAAGLTGVYWSARNRDQTSDISSRHSVSPCPSLISIATMMKISRSLNEHLVPWVYHTTDFYFELTGFTTFLWQSGPLKRREVRRVTFNFSSVALLHCIRWLAPDPIFELFRPPLATDPRALQYMWRCQIQDLSRDLHLVVVTLEIENIPEQDLVMVVRILRQAFGSVEQIRFKVSGVELEMNHWRLSQLGKQRSWRDLCRGWFERYRGNWNYMSRERRQRSLYELEQDMDTEKDFFEG